MKLHELRAVPGATRAPKRKGRGHATGQGTTAGRGMNGQKSRSGGGVRPGFEGGQMPLYRRIPKRGFKNIWAKEFAICNIDDLNAFEAGTTVTPEMLVEAGICKKMLDGIKVLGEGTIEKNLTVQAHKFSKSAIEKIEAAGGKAEVI
ncbi:MAG: 50S ribosomal protein L15 [Firmicutes bacterium]|nr:50S ribosomal protein L15 [Bacillota bacterium]